MKKINCHSCDRHVPLTWFGTKKGNLYPICRRCQQVRTAHSRAKSLGAEGTHTPDQWLALLNYYAPDNRCLGCGRFCVPELDHVVPLSSGGTNYADNLQPLCGSCNSTKQSFIMDYRPDGGAIAAMIAQRNGPKIVVPEPDPWHRHDVFLRLPEIYDMMHAAAITARKTGRRYLGLRRTSQWPGFGILVTDKVTACHAIVKQSPDTTTRAMLKSLVSCWHVDFDEKELDRFLKCYPRPDANRQGMSEP